MTLPAWYAPADRTSQPRPAGGGTFDHVEKLVLHTTETRGWPGYPSFAPHLTYDPWRKLWRQHMPLTRSASTLADSSSTKVRENRDNAIQVEIVAYCDTKLNKPGSGIDYLDDEAVRELARFAAFLHRYGGLKLELAPGWLPYPKSYGNTRNRMSGPTYDAFQGILGHEHVSSNDHGDPGAPPWLDEFLAAAKDLSGDAPAPSRPSAPATSAPILGRPNVKSLRRKVALDQPLSPGRNTVWLNTTKVKGKPDEHALTISTGPQEGVDARAVIDVRDATGKTLEGTRAYFVVSSYKEGTTTVEVDAGLATNGDLVLWGDDLPGKDKDGRSFRLRLAIDVPAGVTGAVLKRVEFSGWQTGDK